MAGEAPVRHAAEFWHDPEFPEIESRRSCQLISCYRPHTHTRFSIGLIEAGHTSFRGYSGQQATLLPGDVILIPAGHIHACNPQNGQWEYQMIHLDQQWLSALLPQAAVRLFSGIRIFREPRLYQSLTEFNDQLFSGPNRNSVQRALREIFTDFDCLPIYESLPMQPDGTDQRLSLVLKKLRDDTPVPHLRELASLMNMSKYQLIRYVRSNTGFTPIAWRHNELVIRSRELLRAGTPIAQAASELGFADQSHFHRVFHAHVAAAPGKYQQPVQYRTRP